MSRGLGDVYKRQKTNRAKSRGKVQDAYADKTCEAGIKRLLPYGN